MLGARSVTGRTNYAGPSGLASFDGFDRAQQYRAFERLPPTLRKRLNDATVPVPASVVLAYYEQQIHRQGRTPAEAEAHCLDKLARTERTAAETLDRERETWNIGAEMAASMKAAHTRRLGARGKPVASRPDPNEGITELYGMKL